MAKDKKKKKEHNDSKMAERARKVQNKRQGRKQNRQKRQGFLAYLKSVRLEMKKVVWPTKRELMQYAAVVVVACAFFAVAFWALDTGFLALLKQLLGISI